MIRRFLILAALSGFFVAGQTGTQSAYAQYDDRYDREYEYDDDDDYDYDRYEYNYDDDSRGGMFAELNVYGRWQRVSPFGWVWRPYVASHWRPYSHGHWAWTQHGWMWIGYEPFAWAAYHYGNWTYQPRLGWIWVPGYDWAPSRVQWIVYDDYVCWAPLPPRHVRIGYPWSRSRVNVWVTVRAGHFTEPNVGRHSVRSKFKAEYARPSVRNDAPDVRYVERYKGRPVSKVDVRMTKSQKGKRELTRVELPAEQIRIRERNPVRVKTRAKYEATRPNVHPQRRIEPPAKERSRQPAVQPSKQPAKQKAKQPAKQKGRPEKQKGARGKG